jgi:hypothetical protein
VTSLRPPLTLALPPFPWVVFWLEKCQSVAAATPYPFRRPVRLCPAFEGAWPSPPRFARKCQEAFGSVPGRRLLAQSCRRATLIRLPRGLSVRRGAREGGGRFFRSIRSHLINRRSGRPKDRPFALLSRFVFYAVLFAFHFSNAAAGIYEMVSKILERTITFILANSDFRLKN